MSDELLRYYNSELQFLRRQGDEFAKAFPRVADHLRIGDEGGQDPYVARLVEAFAFLNARTRMKIEDEFPEIASSITEIILPHFQRQIPSAFIGQFELDRSQTELFQGYSIERGAQAESGPVDGEACRFRTCYDVHCWPFEITGIELRGQPFNAPKFDLAETELGLLKIQLGTFGRKHPFSSFDAETLRFHIQLKTEAASFQFYELIFNNVIALAVGGSPDEPARICEAEIGEVGFGLDQGLVDYPLQSFPGYRLLSEYFAFPKKFLFFDVHLGNLLKQHESSEVSLYFYLRDAWPELSRFVEGDSLKLGCTPLVNLFKERAEPIRLEHFESSHVVVPDIRRPTALEVYSIESVSGVSASGEVLDFQPFYSLKHHSTGGSRAFWHGTRRSMHAAGEAEEGTEISISFVDLDFDPLDPGKWTIDIEILCTNRSLPAKLPMADFSFSAGGVVEKVKCLSSPTKPLRPPIQDELRWRVVSHLSLNHLSLVDLVESSGESGAVAMRELLTLYDFEQNEFTARSVAGLESIKYKRILGRVPGDNSGAMCRGMEIELTFDEQQNFSANNLFLFASVLDKFLCLYANINSFTQVVAKSNSRPRVLHRWPARIGLQKTV